MSPQPWQPMMARNLPTHNLQFTELYHIYKENLSQAYRLIKKQVAQFIVSVTLLQIICFSHDRIFKCFKTANSTPAQIHL